MPSDAIRDVAHQIIGEVRSDPPLVTTADDAALFLRNTVSHFRTIISPSHLERLEQTDIYVVLKPICNAYANNVDGSIVIFDGLLKAAYLSDGNLAPHRQSAEAFQCGLGQVWNVGQRFPRHRFQCPVPISPL